jgi:hypothetical protein
MGNAYKNKKTKTKYTPEELLDIIKKGVFEGKIHLKDYKSRKSICKAFGTWNEALRIAGIEPARRVKSYTKDELVEALINKYKKTNKVPLYRDTSFALSVAKEFGSWNKGLEAAGLNVNIETRDRIQLTNDELKQAYIKLSTCLIKEEYGASKKDINEAFRKGEFPCSENSLSARFSTLNNLKKECGFKKWKREVKYTKEELTKLLRDKVKRFGRNLTITEIKNDKELPSLPVFYKRFQTYHLSEIYKEIE